jgi:hypothetical protein
MNLIIIICGIIALILIFISFTWNPEQNEDGVELNIGEPIEDAVEFEKKWGKDPIKPIDVDEYSASSICAGKNNTALGFQAGHGVNNVDLQDIHIHKSNNEEEKCNSSDEAIGKELPSIINDSPILPYPTSEELGIRRKSKLDNVYNHLIKYGKLTPKSYNKLDIVRGNTYIFKLRQKGIKIETIRDKKGNFIKYILK